jgi:cyclophilin family peptidyl-prolyl cis-trans isomerase
MLNFGPNTNGSQFFITFSPCPHLDGKHVVFGELVEGDSVLDSMEKCVTGLYDRPVPEIKITNCGTISLK